jgi:hypothetical protein
MAITVPYQVLHKGYQVTGDTRSGYHATVPYLVEWGDAFTFADEIFGSSNAQTVGPITFTLPHRFPAATADLYANKFTIEPSGHNGLSVGSMKGLAPGENFTHAIVRVEYGPPEAMQQPSDDDNNLQQLDKDNPITRCKQSVKTTAKMETKKAGTYLFSGGVHPLKGDIAVPVPESRLSLSFPDVPYLPWKLIKPYIGKVNSIAMLECAKGELLLEDFSTEITATSQGLAQQVTLEFAVGPYGDWNLIPNKSGNPTLVYRNGFSDADANRIYRYVDFREIFDKVTYA